ncbi:hypothetical protein BBAD15_g9291 [Beauveria bassiana D1-5]|uniref:Uncharacterized protein n=1 Tax=Beauveria bassiana D1-5 TaxID=1245745 RepID=A0A0A2VD36_BEABA|nr:hypothetical protein BBAD15_g9291 [Beauveria bassiana D1-5]
MGRSDTARIRHRKDKLASPVLKQRTALAAWGQPNSISLTSRSSPGALCWQLGNDNNDYGPATFIGAHVANSQHWRHPSPRWRQSKGRSAVASLMHLWHLHFECAVAGL